MNARLANVADETKNLRSLKLIIGDIDIVFFLFGMSKLTTVDSSTKVKRSSRSVEGT
jgi:hypothetical protein